MTTAMPSGTVTFLFTDIEGSTRLLHSLGDRYRPLLEEHHRLIRSAVESRQGVVVNTMGDGVFAAFANATSAVAAAVDGQRLLCTHAWPTDNKVRVRMGLHSGEAAPQDGAYVSLAVHHASRVGDVGHGGQIVLSDTTRALLDGTESTWFFRDLGPHRLKDLTSAVHLHQVCHPDLPDAFPPLRSLDQVAHNLPVQLTTFVGREDEVREVSKLVTDDRLVTVTGAGGSGKTRLALHVAADVASDFDGGVWLVELAPLVDQDAVIFAVADAMHVRAEPGRSPRELLLERLRAGPTLVLLDNCEHVLAAATDLAAAILSSCPEAKVLTTSREPLGVPGETVWRIPSMATVDIFGDTYASDAVRLFLERAGHVRPDWHPASDDERDAVADICERLDGIPLAIELAAARLDVLDVAQIQTRLHDRFRLLTGGSRVTLERQRTLRAAVDWSHALLDEPSRILFRRLAVFSGGFTLEGAEAVAGGHGLHSDDVLDLLGDLVRKSLVVDDRSRTPRRYRMLETVRQYAREALMDAGEAPEVQEKHYAWILNVVSWHKGPLDYVDLDWNASVAAEDAEHDNVVGALTWAADLNEPAKLDALLWNLDRWATLGHYNLLSHWCDVALAHPGARLIYWRGRLLIAKAVVTRRLGDLSASRSLHDEGVDLVTDDPDIATRRILLNNEAILLSEEDDNEGARRVNDEALELVRQIGDRVHEASLLSNQSTMLAALGDVDGAIDCLHESRLVARAANAPLALAYATANLCAMLYARDELVEADALLEEAHDLVAQVGDSLLLGGVLWMRFMRAIRNDVDRAEAIAKEQLALSRRTGIMRSELNSLGAIGMLTWLRGDPRAAAHIFDEAHRKWRRTVSADAPSTGLDALAAHARGDFGEAARLADESYRPVLGSNTQTGALAAVALRDAAGIRRWAQRAEEQRSQLGAPGVDSWITDALALAAVLEGDLVAAHAHVARSIEKELRDEAILWLLDALEVLGVVEAADGNSEGAGICFAASTVVRNATGMLLTPLMAGNWVAEARAAAEAKDPTAFAAGTKRGEQVAVDDFLGFVHEVQVAFALSAVQRRSRPVEP